MGAVAMPPRHRMGKAAALCVVAMLAACGGGGGGGGGGLPIFPSAAPGAGSPAPAPAPAPTPANDTVVLSGTATYESVPNPSGALVYAEVASKPIRGAVVEVLDANGGVLATTRTDGMGRYAATVPANTLVAVRVRAEMLQTGGGASWNVSVRDNTRSEALYSIQSPNFSTTGAASSRDLHAPTGWSGSGYTALRAAAPFAVLDTIYAAQAKVLEVAPNAAFPPLRVFWSVNNLPAGGNLAAGEIGTTFFSDGRAGKAIYVLGKENVDTDEFDASVVAHEWGHYYQASFSRDDSTGGDHALAERVDRRLAFSEGWGNAWSGIALGRVNYTDAVGATQAQGLNVDLSVGQATDPGWFREASIQSILWNLNQQVGFKPIHDALSSNAFRNTAAVTSIHPFTAALNAAAPASAAALASLLGAQRISAADDPFGAAETNDGGLPLALPMYSSVGIGTPSRVCVSNSNGMGNKHGSYAYLRFTAPTARAYTITVDGSGAFPVPDPDFTVFRGGAVFRSVELGSTETGSATLSAGEHVIAVNDYNDTSASTCFVVSIN